MAAKPARGYAVNEPNPKKKEIFVKVKIKA